MNRSIEDTPIIFIGAGNLATNLAKALYYKGFRIVQVYSRTEESARALAEQVEAGYTTDLQEISKEARLYIASDNGRKARCAVGTYGGQYPDECLGEICGTLWSVLPHADFQ